VFLSTINTQPSTGLANFSDKEKDEAGLSDDFRQDSLDAFILRFAGMKVFLFASRFGAPPSGGSPECRLKAELQTAFFPALVSQPKPVP
jgi:hypothetical protein